VTGLAASVCLVTAALAVAWPARSPRARQRRLGLAHPPLIRWRERIGPVGVRDVYGRLVSGGGRWAVVALVAALGLVAGGPVAAVVVAGYGAMVSRALADRERRRVARQARARALDALGVLAAELRAGLPPVAAEASVVGFALRGAPLVAASPHDGPAPTDSLAARAAAAVSLAESTGAPLADLLERMEADARASDRAAAVAHAQSAGARATAWLLAGLPVAGLALGYGIGADPLRVLLHTPVGAGCALAAMALQLAGLAWSNRLAKGVVTP
jgi:tight adherence protein B